jgi:DNA-binding NarL/FixJ family response regulator
MSKLNRAVEPMSDKFEQRLSADETAQNANVIGIRDTILIERRPFLRECFARALRSSSPSRVLSFSSIAEWLDSALVADNSLVILSTVTLSLDEIRSELLSLSTISCAAPIIVLAANDVPSNALDALLRGAKGYISSNVSLDFAIQTMNFVSAGGTYIPAGCLVDAHIAAGQSSPNAVRGVNGQFTSRELAVIQLIRQGRSNKTIANALKMCESTVKVHVRHIMKKTRTRNRTELAMMSGELLNAQTSGAAVLETLESANKKGLSLP